jgi:hypothetical protein
MVEPKRSILVDLAQVEVIVALALHTDQAFGILVAGLGGLRVFSGSIGTRPIPTIDLANVHDDINVIGADFITANICRAGVRCNVDLAQDIEEVCLFDAAIAAEAAEQTLQRGELGDQLLDHFAKRLEDAVVVNTRLIETDRRIVISLVRQLVLHALDDVPEDIAPVIVGEGVHLVDKDFDIDIGVFALQVDDGSVQSGDRIHVLVLGIDDPDQRSNFVEDGVHIEGWIEVVEMAGEIPNLEIHKRAAWSSVPHPFEWPHRGQARRQSLLHGLSFDPSGGLKIEGLAGR